MALCGRLPLALTIVGSMPVVKGKGLTTGGWKKLIREFESRLGRGEQSTSLDMVLGASFDALGEKEQEQFLKMAVLAAGAVAPTEMLANLWGIQVLMARLHLMGLHLGS